MGARTEPIGPNELDEFFAPLVAAGECVALAVSGGSDSTALMVLFADWLCRSSADPTLHTVLTVDHRLRPESGAEAAAVARHAALLGFRHAILVWEGPKPETGLQAAARAARHQLCANYASRRGIGKLLTAHTADDQAETLLMRLARGSGLDGLAAMAPLTCMAVPGNAGQPGLMIARPLLEVSKARLRATLAQRGIAWIEDPSNQSPAFERTRLRAARAQLEALGLTADMLGLSARRLRRARAALERWVADFCNPDAALFHADPCGFIRVDGPALRGLPMEVAVRVLLRAVVLAGGSDAPVPLAKLEAIADAISAAPASGTWTLARAKICASPASILVEREPGRVPLPTLTLEPGTQAVWDGRFRVAAGSRLAASVVVRALGVDGVREMRQAVTIPPSVPIGALRLLPGFWRGSSVIAVPSLGFWIEDSLREEVSAVFAVPGNYNPASAQDDPGTP